MQADEVAAVKARQDQIEKSVDGVVLSIKELTREMSKLILTLNDSVNEQRHSNETINRMRNDYEKMQIEQNKIKEKMAANQPWIDTIKATQRTFIGTIVVGIMAAIYYVMGNK